MEHSKWTAPELLKDYDLSKITIGVLGGHSALEVCEGAKKLGFRTLAVCQKGREKVYQNYYKSRGEQGCIDEVLIVEHFADIVKPEVQKELRKHNTIFVHNRYFWVYCDFNEIEENFKVPIYGTRHLVRLEERAEPKNQAWLLEQAGIRIPKILRPGNSGMTETNLRRTLDEHFVGQKGGPLFVKVNEATRTYERQFFIITREEDYFDIGQKKIANGEITESGLQEAMIEEFVMGAQINLNFFYSALSGELELMGTDMRRQTSMDGFLRLDAKTQMELLEKGFQPSIVETGHVSVTMKESLLEKAFELGERFVKTTKEHAAPGIIGPFALQGAVSAEAGREEFVIFDVSMRIPGSPGTRFTPYTSYLWGRPMSYGERIALEIQEAIKLGRLNEIVT